MEDCSRHITELSHTGWRRWSPKKGVLEITYVLRAKSQRLSAIPAIDSLQTRRSKQAERPAWVEPSRDHVAAFGLGFSHSITWLQPCRETRAPSTPPSLSASKLCLRRWQWSVTRRDLELSQFVRAGNGPVTVDDKGAGVCRMIYIHHSIQKLKPGCDRWGHLSP